MNILVFEDELVSRLNPATTGRPAFDVTVATRRLSEWLCQLEGPVTAAVREHLRELLHADHPHIRRQIESGTAMTLLVNARAVPNQQTWQTLFRMRSQSAPMQVTGTGGVVAAALVPTADAERIFGRSPQPCTQSSLQAALTQIPQAESELTLIEHPHDLVRHNLTDFSANLSHRLASANYREISDGVFVSGEVAISDFVVTNTRNGPIVIESGTVIGPFCFLRGPIHIGSGSRVNEHSAIKDSVSIGHTCKIGGEVEGSVIEPFSNKQHHGFLGHSYLGSWINLGAGTCNSDLKNTYGEVKMDYRGEKVATGMQFIGCIMGDYSKTAINTSIFTGKTVGVCSMLYGFVTTNVPSFSNYARTFSQMTESPPAVMELTQKRMFARRNVEQRQIDIDLLHAMYDLTRHERQISEEPLNL